LHEIFALLIDIKQRKLKRDLQLQLRKILMEKRNLFFHY